MKLYDWQWRLMAEKEQHDSRMGAVIEFVNSATYSTIPKQDQQDLDTQLSAMQAYSDILAVRINRTILGVEPAEVGDKDVNNT